MGPSPHQQQFLIPFSTGVSYIKRRQAQRAHVKLIPEHGPHHWGHPGKACKGQETCIVHRVGPTHGNIRH